MRISLGYVPRAKRFEDLERIRAFLPRVDPTRKYSYSTVCYKITGFRPPDDDNVKILGKDLIADLSLLFFELSGICGLYAADLGEPFWTEEELQRGFDLSPEHLDRWLAAGLLAYEISHTDQSVVVFLQSDVWAFLERNATRCDIVVKARAIRKERGVGLAACAVRLASETGLSPESVLLSIKRHDEETPSDAVYPEMLQPPRSVGDGFSRRYRTSLRCRTECLRLSAGTEAFRYSPEFAAPGAEAHILELGEGTGAAPCGDLDSYLGQLGSEAMDHEEQTRYFRAYNYAKWRIHCILAERAPSEFDRRVAEEVRRLNRVMECTRNRLTESNLRLVANVAIKHIGCGRPPDELISDGIVSLLAAIEGFDFTKGTRFSTYLTWALMKNYAKALSREGQRRVSSSGDEALSELVAPSSGGISPKVRDAIKAALDSLTDQERQVIAARFGFSENGECKPLRVIAQMLGISHEGVRKLENRALLRLKAILSASGNI